MGTLRAASDGRVVLLEPEHLIGRGLVCGLRIDERYVSAQHALVRWTGGRWLLRDLGSRNGTYVEGRRLNPGEEHTIAPGESLAFGSPEPRWVVVDDAAPRAMAIPAGGEPIVIEGDLLAIPSSDEPLATIYRADDAWVLEHADGHSVPLRNRHDFEIAGKAWRFSAPESVPLTAPRAAPSLPLEVRRLELSFTVSRDEEHVEIQARHGGSTIDLGARGHNFLLLTLARRRVADAARGVEDDRCGWLQVDELARDPTMSPPQLNIDVFRIRKQFAAAGVLDAVNIVERDPKRREIRIGTGRVAITVL